MAYPIPEYVMETLTVSGCIEELFTTYNNTAYMKFIILMTATDSYKICVPIFSKFIILVPNLINIPITVKLLACTTKGSTRYSLLNINTIEKIKKIEKTEVSLCQI